MPAQTNPSSPSASPSRISSPKVSSEPVSAPEVLARSTYQELKNGGLSDTDIIAFAGELLSLVATEVSSQKAAE